MPKMSPEFDGLLPEVGFTRRSFVATALASGFAAAVQPVMAQQVITTDTEGLKAGEIVIPSNGTPLPGYSARPAKGTKFPVVLVVQEIFGVHEHIKDVCRRLAKLGYLATAPELYYKFGNVAEMTNVQEILDKVVSRVPPRAVATALGLGYRLLYLTLDELERLQRAARSRNAGGGAARRRDLLVAVTAATLGRSFARGERTYRAMLARGFSGDLPPLDEPRWTVSGALQLGALALLTLSIAAWAWATG